MYCKSFVILLVEDEEAHAKAVLRSLKSGRVINEIHHVSDGEAALNYLYNRAEFSDAEKYPRPHLVLLDLRLPKVDGLEVLKTIKEDPQLRNIVVVILTTSDAETDKAKAYKYNANSYLVKPMDFEKFLKLMDVLELYWLICNEYS